VSNVKTRNFLAASALLLGMLACNSTQPANQVRPSPTPIVFPTHAEGWLPNSDEEVPRVTVEDAFIAFANDEAIIVDVRDLVAYEDSHIAGAISIPLGVIETNPEGLGDLPDKDQWIITYCT
jgi:hypothetical protein